MQQQNLQIEIEAMLTMEATRAKKGSNTFKMVLVFWWMTP